MALLYVVVITKAREHADTVDRKQQYRHDSHNLTNFDAVLNTGLNEQYSWKEV